MTAVPGAALHPVDGVEERVGGAIAGVDGVGALERGVARGCEELSEDGLDGLGLVKGGLGADFEAADGGGVDVVFREEGGYGC